MFLGDDNPNKTALDMGSDYYYTTYADADGHFAFSHVRARSYGLQAWSNGSALADVSTSFLQNGVEVLADQETALGELEWTVSDKSQLFRVGDFDRYAYGFRYGGAPYTHALADNCSADITYVVGSSDSEEWCFAQSKVGNWTIEFEIASGGVVAGKEEATLIVSLAGYTTGTDASIYVNGKALVGNLTGGTSTGLLLNDKSLYRSATVAGEWRYREFSFDAGVLQTGANSVTFAVTKASAWHGFIWDSILLEV